MEEQRRIMDEMIASGVPLTDPRLVKQSQIVDEEHNMFLRNGKQAWEG